ELIDYLNENKINYDRVTVCTSISGGYTPMQWRCLASYVEHYLRYTKKLFPLELLIKGSTLYWQGLKEQAKRYFGELVDKHQDQQFLECVHLWLLRINVELDNYSTAKSHLCLLNRYDSYYSTYWICPGFSYFYHDEYTKAIYYFNKWKPILYTNPKFYFAWAESTFDYNIDLSIKLCEKTIELDQNLVDAHKHLGNCFKNLDR